jgi:hypothetical protein
LRAWNTESGALHPGVFNDTDWQVPKPSDSLRIAALGDSFAYGIVGYPNNFLTLLEPLLGERLGHRVEVANLGLPELHPSDYLYLLEQEGVALEPDAVLVLLYAGNDFHLAKPRSWFDLRCYRVFEFTRRAALLSAELVPRAREDGAGAGQPLRRSAAAPPGTVTSEQPGMSVEGYQRILIDYAALLRPDAGTDPKTRERIASTLEVLDRIVALARPRPVAIAVLPSELQVDRGLQEAVSAEIGIPRDELDLNRPFRLVADHFAGRGVLVIDLLPAIAAAHRAAPAYHQRDTHWNERGNTAAAAALADAIAPWLSAVARSAP